MEKEILSILKSMQGDIKSMQSDIQSIQGDVSSLKAQVTENTQILRALEHSAQVNRSEHDAMINDIAEIKGDVAAIKKDLCRVEEATAHNWVDIAKLKSLKIV